MNKVEQFVSQASNAVTKNPFTCSWGVNHLVFKNQCSSVWGMDAAFDSWLQPFTNPILVFQQ